MDAQQNLVIKLEHQVKKLNGEIEIKEKQVESLMKHNNNLLKDIDLVNKKISD